MVTVSLRKGQGRAFPAAGPACLKTELGTGGQGADFTIRAGGSLGRVLNFPKVHCHHLQLAIISDLQDTHEDLITKLPLLILGPWEKSALEKWQQSISLHSVPL